MTEQEVPQDALLVKELLESMVSRNLAGRCEAPASLTLIKLQIVCIALELVDVHQNKILCGTKVPVLAAISVFDLPFKQSCAGTEAL